MNLVPWASRKWALRTQVSYKTGSTERMPRNGGFPSRPIGVFTLIVCDVPLEKDGADPYAYQSDALQS